MTEKKKPLVEYTKEGRAAADKFAKAFLKGMNSKPEKDRPKEKK